MVSRFVVLMMLVAVSSAATWMGRLPKKPKEFANKEGCYVKEINDVIPFGEEVSPVGFCYRIECSRHMMYYASCGKLSSYGLPGNCYITDVDLSRPYPSCCPDVYCDIDNNQI